ncbi:hypothetical protein [Kineococcus sp. NUM-3379]
MSEAMGQAADASMLDVVMEQFVRSAKNGEVVWLREDGHPVGAIAPLDVVQAGLRALGRES